MVNKQDEQAGHVEHTAAGNDDQSPPETPRPVILWSAPDDPHATIPIGDEQREQDRRSKRTARIALLNDLCRIAMGLTGRVMLTQGICALPPAVQSAICERVQTFNEFSTDNNPYGERDSGSFEYEEHRVLWKIDYYDRDLEYGSEDPSDPAQTTRVLTIMLSDEY